MKIIIKILYLSALISFSLVAGEKRALVEIFTNSHCSLCPSAYSTMDNYLQSANGNKIEFIYYHMSFPYSDDQLNKHNPDDAASKNSYYGPHSSTPKAYFDGNLISNSYNNWAESLNSLITEESKIDISLSGKLNEGSFTITSDVTQTQNISNPNFTINYVVVEDINYTGRNGIADHKNVMRKIANPQGDPFSLTINETKNHVATFNFNPEWNSENIKVIVFVQNSVSQEIYQSASIQYSEFGITGVDDENTLANIFRLKQNYPNPFNPTTKIEYSIPATFGSLNGQQVILKVYDVLGKEIITLVNAKQNFGNHEVVFNASNLSAGFYYYQLSVGNYKETKKMILLK